MGWVESIKSLASMILFAMGIFISFGGQYDAATFLIATAAWVKI